MTRTTLTTTPVPDEGGARPRGEGRWWSSSAGFVSLGAVLAITAGTFAALFGFGHADHTVQFLRGNAWLANDQTGSVVRVNGATGKPDFEMKFKGASGNDLQVIQGTDGVFVLNRLTGEVTKLDDAQLQIGGSIKTDPADQPLFVLGGGKAYVVAQRTGRVQQVDPKSASLDSVGNPVELGHAVANALVDDRGRLVASTPDTGEIAFAIDNKKDAPVKVAEAGDKLTVSLVSDQLVAVDHTKGTVAPVDPAKGVLAVFGIEGPHDDEVAVVDKMTGNRLWLVHVGSAELLGIDLRDGKQLHIPLQDSKGHDLGAPLPNGRFVYVPDYASGELVKVDADAATIVERVPVTSDKKGRFESFVKDDRVWGNDAVGELAVVIDHDGNAQRVEKYRPGLPSNDDVFDTPASTPTTPPTTKASAPSTTTTTKPVTPPTLDPLDPGKANDPNKPLDPGKPAEPTKADPKPATDPTKGTPPTGANPTPPPVAAKPGSVAPATASAGDATAHVQWTAAADNGSPLTKYVVFDPVLGPRDVAPTATSLDLTGLTNGATYTFSIHAVNAIGDGPTTTTSPVTPQPNLPGVPENVVGVLVADPAAPTVQTAIKLRWDAPTVHPELVKEYRYACPKLLDTTATPSIMPATSPSFSVVISGQDHVMPNGYTCWVQVVDTSGTPRGRADLPIAATLYPFAAPGVATGLANSIILPDDAKGTSNSCTLSWVAPADDGGRGIDSYEVEVESYSSILGGWSHYVSLIAPGTDSSISFTGFPTGTYRFHVRARGTTDTATGLQFIGAFSDYHQF